MCVGPFQVVFLFFVFLEKLHPLTVIVILFKNTALGDYLLAFWVYLGMPNRCHLKTFIILRINQKPLQASLVNGVGDQIPFLVLSYF